MAVGGVPLKATKTKSKIPSKRRRDTLFRTLTEGPPIGCLDLWFGLVVWDLNGSLVLVEGKWGSPPVNQQPIRLQTNSREADTSPLSLFFNYHMHLVQ